MTSWGGNQPLTFSFCEMSGGFETLEEEFEQEKTPAGYEDRIGARDYPVWAALVHQMQALSMPDQICTGKPYPIRGMMALGLNHRIFPDSDRFREALGKLDFFVDFDLFLTDTAKMADVVLPACSSFEREEIKTYPGGFTKYYTPVIEPLYDSRNDARILQDLAKRMKFDDELLCGGYRRCIEHIFQHTGYDIGELEASPLPVKAKGLQPYRPLAYLEQGCKTPSGKLELYSEIIAVNGKEKGLEPLPKWYEPFTRPSKEWPFLLLAGVRIPNAIHTQLHKASWPRALRPDAMADISLADAKRMGIVLGDEICLYNQFGSITVKANPTGLVEEGQVYMYHGYAEADVSKLLSLQDTDPYSGFPAYKSASCNIRKVKGNAQ